VTGAPAPASAAARPLGVAQTTPYRPELEGLRGVAMLLVVAFHADGLVHIMVGRPETGEVVSPWYALIRSGGDLGVDLFFVLSSFLLALPFVRANVLRRPLSMRRFFERRALRILPLYYAAVLAGAAWNAQQIADLSRALPYLAFLNSFPATSVPLMPFSAPWWSLAT
jgi:peptidoglycan/LPS O-acetylase OafA/YrhL